MLKLSSNAKTFLLLLGKKIVNQGIIFEDIVKLKEPFKKAVNNLDDAVLQKELRENFKYALQFLKKKLKKLKVSSVIQEEPAEGAIPEGSPEVPVEQSLSDAISDTRLKFPFNLYLKKPMIEESLDWLTGKEQNAVCSFYALNQMGNSNSCDKLLETLTQRFQNDTKKPNKILPWLNKLKKFEKLCLGAQETLPLQNTLLFFLSKITPVAEKCIKKNKPKRAKILLKPIVSFLHRCHLLKRTIPSHKVMKKPCYEDLIAAILSVYVDLEIIASVEQVLPSVVSRRIIATMSALLGPCHPHCLDVLLQTSKSTRENKPIMWPVFWSLLYLPPDVSSFSIYLRYMICVKYAKSLADKDEYKKLRKIVTCLPAPPNFWKWLLELNSDLRKLIPSLDMEGMSITHFLLKRSFNSKICQEILERIAEYPDLGFVDNISSPQQEEKKLLENNLFFIDTTANKELLPTVEENDQIVEVSEGEILTKATVDTILEEISFAQLPENECGEEVETFEDSLTSVTVTGQQMINLVNTWFNHSKDHSHDDDELEVPQRDKTSSKSKLNKAKRNSMKKSDVQYSTSSLNKSNSINDVKLPVSDEDLMFNYEQVQFSDQPLSPIITPKLQRKNSVERRLSNSDKSKSSLKISFTNTQGVISPTNVESDKQDYECIDLDLMVEDDIFSSKDGHVNLECSSQAEKINSRCLSPLASNSPVPTIKKEIDISAHAILLKDVQQDDQNKLQNVVTLSDSDSPTSLIVSDSDDDVIFKELPNHLSVVSSNEKNSLTGKTKKRTSTNSCELAFEKFPLSEMVSSGHLSSNGQTHSGKKISKKISITPLERSSDKIYALQSDSPEDDDDVPYKQNDSERKYRKSHSFETSKDKIEILQLDSFDFANNKHKSSTPKTMRRSSSYESSDEKVEVLECNSSDSTKKQKKPIQSRNSSFESSKLNVLLDNSSSDISVPNKQKDSSSKNNDHVILKEKTNQQASFSNEQNSLSGKTKKKMSNHSFELTSENFAMDSSGHLSSNGQSLSAKKLKQKISTTPSELSIEKKYLLESDSCDDVAPYKQKDSSKKSRNSHSFESLKEKVEILGLESFDSTNKQKNSASKTKRRSSSFELSNEKLEVLEYGGATTNNKPNDPIKSRNTSFESSEVNSSVISTFNKQKNSSRNNKSNSFVLSNKKAESDYDDNDSSEDEVDSSSDDEILLWPSSGLDSNLSPKMMENAKMCNSFTPSIKTNSRSSVSKISSDKIVICKANEKVKSQKHILADSSQFNLAKRQRMQNREVDSDDELSPVETKVTRRRSELIKCSKNANISNSSFLTRRRYSEAYQSIQKLTADSDKSILKDTKLKYPIKLRPRKSTLCYNLENLSKDSARLSDRGETVKDNRFDLEKENSNSQSTGNKVTTKRNLATVAEKNVKIDKSASSPAKRNSQKSSVAKKSPRQTNLRSGYSLRSKPRK